LWKLRLFVDFLFFLVKFVIEGWRFGFVFVTIGRTRGEFKGSEENSPFGLVVANVITTRARLNRWANYGSKDLRLAG
jgi:hypothetical protein